MNLRNEIKKIQNKSHTDSMLRQGNPPVDEREALVALFKKWALKVEKQVAWDVRTLPRTTVVPEHELDAFDLLFRMRIKELTK